MFAEDLGNIYKKRLAAQRNNNIRKKQKGGFPHLFVIIRSFVKREVVGLLFGLEDKIILEFVI